MVLALLKMERIEQPDYKGGRAVWVSLWGGFFWAFLYRSLMNKDSCGNPCFEG